MELDHKSIGARIKAARTGADISQEHLAELVGITPSHLSNIESGKSRAGLKTLIRIADALSMTADDLLYNKEQKSATQNMNDVALMLADCNNNELRVIKEVIEFTKSLIRQYK